MWTITDTEVLPLQAPLIQPFRTALGEHDTLDNFLFVVHLNKIRGYGEAAVASHITGEELAQTGRHLKTAGNWLCGRDIRHYLSISAQLHERYPNNPSVIAAVETALMDALTRIWGIPLWKFFGGKCRLLRSDITVVIADLKETEESARRFVRQGFRALKIKIGRDPDLDLKRVLAVKKIAPKTQFYLDANQGFSAGEILKFLKLLQRYEVRISLLEQPVPREDWEGLKKVSRSTKIPVCADESVRSIAEALKIIKEKAAPVINIKLMKFGMVHSREIALLAQRAGVKLMIGGMLESSVAMTASAHIAAGMNCFSYIDLDTPFFIRDDVKRNRYLSSRGVYDLRKVKAGIGLEPKI